MGKRHVLAIAWGVLVLAALTSWLARQPLALFGLWFATLMLLTLSSALARPQTDERLELPVAYRAAAAVAFALPLAGALLSQVPHASGVSSLFAPYFALMAWLGYRTLVARGSHRALFATTVGILVWLPFCVFLGVGCKCGPPKPPHWTELATLRILLATQLVNALTSAVALLAFQPHAEGLPEARVTR
jgi:hypothetical protein